MYKNHILMDGISDMIFVVNVKEDSVFTYEFLNRAAMDKTGLTKDIIGKTIQEVYMFSEEFGSSLYQKYERVVFLKDSATYDDLYVSSTGETYYSNTKLTPLFDEEKNCKQIVAVVKDITKEKRAEIKIYKTWEELNESNKRYQSLFDYNSDAILSFDLEGCIMDGNISVESITGYKASELIGSTLNSIVIDEDVNLVEKLFFDALRGSHENSHLTIRTKNGGEVYITLKVTPLVIDDKVIGVYGILRDVTDVIEKNRKLQESEERFRIIAENAHDLITLIDENGKIIYASPSYKDVLGLDYKEYVGKLFLHNIHPDDQREIEKKVLNSIQKAETFKVKFRQFNNRNETVWNEASGSPVFDESGNFKHLVVITRDIDLQKQYETKLEFFALHDSLTGLPNRRYFMKRLESVLPEFKENNDGLAVIMMDIDDFKEINDNFGHDVGDKVIEEFALRVSNTIGENNIVARLGGDEFVILLPRIGDSENAVTIAQNILIVMQNSWDEQGCPSNVTTSMGIAMATKNSTSFELLKNADVALYRTKSLGKSSYQLIEPTEQISQELTNSQKVFSISNFYKKIKQAKIK